jgi:peptidoglycan/xylan/chitin deacetylase (PgdA/CDA1 family)
MRTYIYSILFFLLALPALNGARAAAAVLEQDDRAAVILAYYRIGEDHYGDASLPLDEFMAHIRQIKEDGYRVIGLPQLIHAFEKNEPIPERTLVITFQGAYRSALQNAFPVLLREKMPFTVFYSGAQADSASEDTASWKDLERLVDNEIVTLGLLPDSYDRMAGTQPEEIKRQVNNAILKYRQHFKTEPRFFAYPYGEHSKEFRSIVASAGFRAALGLQSGAAYDGGDIYALPRFSMSGPYGDLDRFNMVAQALPFPVYDQQPADSFTDLSAPLGFSVPPALEKDLGNLNCFISGEEKPDMEIIGNRVELRPRNAAGTDRMRVNCTLPSGLTSGDGPRWRWFGMLLAGPA